MAVGGCRMEGARGGQTQPTQQSNLRRQGERMEVRRRAVE